MPPAVIDSPACVRAPSAWQRIDFISDLHLDPTQVATFEAWVQYMAHTPADALFILGDLFEVWVGDDNPESFAQQCAAVLKATTQRIPVYFMHGNRDFLVGPDLIQRTGMHDLADPTVLDLSPAIATGKSLRILLTHGDALCLDDQEYLSFRAQVRTPQWQSQFLSKSLVERQAYARELRTSSEERKQTTTLRDYPDVDAQAAAAWLTAANANILLHGHTHKPAEHDLGQGRTRWVLSDWDAQATPARLEVLTWRRAHVHDATYGLCRGPSRR